MQFHVFNGTKMSDSNYTYAVGYVQCFLLATQKLIHLITLLKKHKTLKPTKHNPQGTFCFIYTLTQSC